MKPALLIDFDGTLCHDRFWRSLEPAENREAVQRFVFAENKELVGEWMKGKLSSEEVNHLVADRLQIDYQSLWYTFVSDCTAMKVDAADLKRIAILKKTYNVILITDNMDSFERFTVQALKLKDHFDVIISSSSEGVFKNEDGGALIRIALERAGSAARGSVFIDNSPKTCALFDEMRGRSLLVTKESPLSHWLDLLSSV